MNQPLTHSTPMQLYRRGLTALQSELGPVDSIRFLHLFDHGSGDYTAERQAKEDNGTVDEVCEQIRAAMKKPLAPSVEAKVFNVTEQRAQRGKLADLDAILAAVPDVPPVAGDEK